MFQRHEVIMKPNTDYPQLIQQFINDEKLPATYLDDALEWFLPLKDQIIAKLRSQVSTLKVVGINGAQGTGKSTLAKLLQRLISADGFNVVNLSIDDFYYAGKKREALSRSIHPLLRSRGVPGTHDVALALEIVESLRGLTNIEQLTLPAFDKAMDEPVAADECIGVYGPVHLLILEGWFIGAKPEQAKALDIAGNEREKKQDPDKTWRQYVNNALAGDYQNLFKLLDMLVLLKAPSFEQVYEWRTLQEHKLISNQPPGKSTMTDEQLVQFIQHFERLTRHCLKTLPAQADVVFHLNTEHRIAKPEQKRR
jgi:D-glycerate 3-kinase